MKHCIRILTLFALLLTPSLLYADTLSLTTYYPAPFGSYSLLRLAPTSDLSMGTCDTAKTGQIYMSSDTNELKICNGTAWNSSGPWTHILASKFVYLTNSVTDTAYKVGIGLNNPSARLHVKGVDDDPYGQLRIESVDSNARLTLVNSTGATDTGTASISMSSDANREGLRFEINGYNAMTIAETYLVGIGNVDDPAALLHVKGINGPPYGQMKIESEDGDAKMTLSSLSGNRGSILYSNTAGSEGMRFLINDADKMILDETGNLGIGLNAPTAILDVARATPTGTVSTAKFDNINLIDENEAAYTANALCAGANCTSANTNFLGVRMYSNTSNTNSLTLNTLDAGGTSTVSMNVGNTAQLVASRTAVTTDTSVNVGIGVPAPTYKLHVSGPIGGNLDSGSPSESGVLMVDCSGGSCYALYAP